MRMRMRMRMRSYLCAQVEHEGLQGTQTPRLCKFTPPAHEHSSHEANFVVEDNASEPEG